MVVGVMELTLALYDNESLKDKRSIVKRVINRAKHTFNVAMAEVDDLDMTDRACLGVVAVGNDRRHIEGLLSKVEKFVEHMHLADVLDAPKTYDAY